LAAASASTPPIAPESNVALIGGSGQGVEQRHVGQRTDRRHRAIRAGFQQRHDVIDQRAMTRAFQREMRLAAQRGHRRHHIDGGTHHLTHRRHMTLRHDHMRHAHGRVSGHRAIHGLANRAEADHRNVDGRVMPCVAGFTHAPAPVP
jgi:hypothetical protein